MRKQDKSLEDIQRLKAETRRQKEIDCVKKRIAFNNSWTDGAMWRDDAFDRLQDYLKVTPIWTNVVLNEENAFDYFDANPIIDKAFSLYLDSFDMIPYHPDLAFDIIWRVFEASLVNYGNTHWKPCPEGTHVLVTRASSEIISALANQDPSLKSLIQEYLEHIPLPLLRYMFARMYYERELGVSQQLELIQSRCKTILGDTYALIKDKYGIKKDSPTIISCPTCGRTKVDIISLTKEVEKRLSGCKKPIKVAVMGCIVNGPGEAREADIGIAGGDGFAVLFKKGEKHRRVEESEIVNELMKEIELL